MMKNDNRGIWQFSRFLSPINEKYKLSLGEGSTPLVKKEGIFFKCEYENPTGSVKDRGICFQIAKLKEKGVRSTVISSSGNAAISASRYCNLHKIELSVFVSPSVNPFKFKAIKNNIKIIKSKKPVSDAFKFSKNEKIPNLRPSKDDFGSAGFQTISFELAKINPKIDALFIPVSSGCVLKGIYEGFSKLKLYPAIHAVQTSRVHPLAEKFDSNFKIENKSLADAIVAKFMFLEEEIEKIVKKTNGWGWVMSNSDMLVGKNILDEYKLKSSYEGAAAFVAILKAKNKGFHYKNPVCLLTGKYYKDYDQIT